jgi:hypothetical protein
MCEFNEVSQVPEIVERREYEVRRNRDRVADSHRAIDLAFEFSEVLRGLHPHAEYLARQFFKDNF